MTKDRGVIKLQVIKKTQEHRCVRWSLHYQQAFDILLEACSHESKHANNCKTVNTGKEDWYTVTCW